MKKLKTKILELRDKHKSYNEIAKILNCAKSTISYHCKNLNIKLKESEIKKSEIIDFYNKNKNFRETARYFNLTRYKLGKILGIPFNPKKSNCVICGNEIISSISTKKCCSDKCRRKFRLNYFKLNNYQYDKLVIWRKNKKLKAIEYKGGSCQICGYNKCENSLSFHHIEPDKKDFSISSNINWSFEKIKNELDKCVLVCMNCHGEIHSGLHSEFLKLK